MPCQKPGFWKSLSFQAHHTAGRRLVFEISNAYEPGADRLDALQMMYRPYDGHPEPLDGPAAWRVFDFHRHDPEAGVFCFGLDRPCPFAAVHVSVGETYTPDRCGHWINKLDEAGVIRPTPFGEVWGRGWGGGGYAIGQTAPAVDDLGRAWGPMPVPAFRFGRGPARAVLLAGVHPNEGPANWVLQGCVEALLEDNLETTATVDVYPMVNPAGRAAGYNRTTVLHPDRDSNRVWRSGLHEDMPEIHATVRAIQYNLGGVPPAVFIDFHSWCDPRKGPFGILSHADGFHEHPLWRRLCEMEPDLGVMDSDWDNPSTETWAYQDLNAAFCMTFETTFRPDWLAPRLLMLGRHTGRALAQALPRAGSAAVE